MEIVFLEKQNVFFPFLHFILSDLMREKKIKKKKKERNKGSRKKGPVLTFALRGHDSELTSLDPGPCTSEKWIFGVQ